MTITETNYITSHFIDNERKNIQVLLKSDDETSVYTYVLEYNPDDLICKEFLKLCSLDQLHENTYVKKQEERKDFVNQVKRIAQKEGLLKTIIENVDSEFMTLMLDFLLSDKKEHIDRLFNFKIYLFEQNIVKNCKDQSKKTAIRKSKTPLEALKIFIGLWEDSNKT